MRSPRAPQVRRARVAVVGLSVVVAVTLVACSSNETTPPATSSSPAASVPASPASEAPTAAPRSTPSPAARRDNIALAKAAGASAEGKVTGATVTSVELDSTEQGGSIWAVTLVTSDGDNADVELSADGRKITRGPTRNVEGPGDRKANRAFVAAAETSYADALDQLPASVAGGRVTSLSLERAEGRTVWRADVTDARGARHAVELDAATGKVLRDQV